MRFNSDAENLHATLMRLRSSIDPLENQGLAALQINSAPSFSADTRNIKIVDVRLASLPSLLTVTSAFRIGSPSNNHVTFYTQEKHILNNIKSLILLMVHTFAGG